MATALLHPLRSRILQIVAVRPATVRMVAGELEEPRERVRKQIRWLEREEIISVFRQLHRRGTAENYYLTRIEPIVATAEFERLSDAERAQLSGVAIKNLYRDATRAVRAGTFDRRNDMASVHVRMLLDEHGWREFSELHRRIADEVLALRRQALERLERSGEEPISAASTNFLFELPDESS